MPTAIGNAFMKAILCSPLHPLLGDSLGVITVTGRKTGRRISTPVNVARREDGFTVVSTRNRTWWKNLRDNRPGELRITGKTMTATARILESEPEVRAGLRDYFELYPAYAKYFGMRMDAEGKIPEAELARIARDRVIIRLAPG
jgi:deazaflavin-dependent oxidoreductase (nitroreductase family)